MAKTDKKTLARLKRKRSIRKKVSGTSERPRLNVFRSAKHIYGQIIDDTTGNTLTMESSLNSSIKDAGLKGKIKIAEKVGEMLAAKAKEKGIKKVVLDRGGNLYHGRIKALSEGAREGGLKF